MLASLKNKMTKSEFNRDENGSIIVFVMVVFAIMMMVGGAAIDLARYENTRSTLQYNLDRAVIAAASLKQERDPSVVVEDFMSRVVMNEEFEISVDSSVADYSRRVSASAHSDVPMWFLSMAGVNKLSARARSAAQEQRSNLEISLVLDVSGSMGSNNRLVNLKKAAKEFVTTMLTDVEAHSVSISIIPFNSNTAPSRELFKAINVNQTHDYTTCLDFEDDSFAQAAIDPDESHAQAVFTSYYGGLNSAHLASSSCNDEGYFEIMPYADNEAQLHAKIDSLQAAGNTAGHVGIKWGLALLDPEFQPVVDNLIIDGEVNSGLTRLPVAYGDEDTNKIIVMMSDGANTTEFRLGAQYNSGASQMYEVTQTGGDPILFLRTQNGQDYFNTTDNVWISRADFLALDTTLAGFTGSRRMMWPEAWGHMSTTYFAAAMQDTGPSNDFLSGAARNGWEANPLMSDSCTAAADQGVTVYTIGFETNDAAETELRNCASSVSHFYDADGTQISEVFSAIATSILKLKLTQ